MKTIEVQLRQAPFKQLVEIPKGAHVEFWGGHWVVLVLPSRIAFYLGTVD